MYVSERVRPCTDRQLGQRGHTYIHTFAFTFASHIWGRASSRSPCNITCNQRMQMWAAYLETNNTILAENVMYCCPFYLIPHPSSCFSPSPQHYPFIAAHITQFPADTFTFLSLSTSFVCATQGAPEEGETIVHFLFSSPPLVHPLSRHGFHFLTPTPPPHSSWYYSLQLPTCQ